VFWESVNKTTFWTKLDPCIYIYTIFIYIYNIYIFIYIYIIHTAYEFLQVFVLVAVLFADFGCNVQNRWFYSGQVTEWIPWVIPPWSLRYVRWLVGLGETHRVWVRSSESIQKRVEYVFSGIHKWKFSGPDGPIRFFQIGKVYGNFLQLEIFRILMGWILWKSGRLADGAPPFNSEVVLRRISKILRRIWLRRRGLARCCEVSHLVDNQGLIKGWEKIRHPKRLICWSVCGLTWSKRYRVNGHVRDAKHTQIWRIQCLLKISEISLSKLLDAECMIFSSCWIWFFVDGRIFSFTLRKLQHVSEWWKPGARCVREKVVARMDTVLFDVMNIMYIYKMSKYTTTFGPQNHKEWRF